GPRAKCSGPAWLTTITDARRLRRFAPYDSIRRTRVRVMLRVKARLQDMTTTNGMHFVRVITFTHRGRRVSGSCSVIHKGHFEQATTGFRAAGAALLTWSLAVVVM